MRSGEINPRGLVTITDITAKEEDQLESTRVRIGQALSVIASDTMSDPSPERSRLKSYGD